MSSSRSIAGARQRRAGEAPPTSGRNNSAMTSQQFLVQQGQQQQGQQQQGQQQQTNTSAKFQSLNSGGPSNFGIQQPQMTTGASSSLKQGPVQIGNGPGQLSVSDAFALVTLRLGKMESLIKKWQDEGFHGETDTQIHSQSGVDTSVLQAIVSRIENVEMSTNTLIANKITAQSIQQQLQSTSYSPEQWNALEEKINVDVENKLENIVKDITEIKDAIIKVQSFTMETNQKLLNRIFQENENELMMMQMMKDLSTNDDEDDEDDENHEDHEDRYNEENNELTLEEGEDNSQEIDCENITVNLKELNQKET
jgi:hypothetical protein